MKIVLDNIVATVFEATDEEHAFLDSLLQYKDLSARHRQYYKGDGYVRLYDRFRATFPTGYIRKVWEEARAAGMEVRLADRRKKPCVRDTTADLGWLRSYQLEAVERCIERTRCIVWAPTGSGKTEIIAALAHSLPCRWLFFADNLQLVEQAAARYEQRTGDTAGIIGSGKWLPRDRFTCATFQTFYRRLKKGDPEAVKLISSVDGVLLDEVHKLPAGSYSYVASKATNAYYRFGFSGTPLHRDDGRAVTIIGTTGPVGYRIMAQTLIDAGVLAKPSIRMVRCEQYNDVSIARSPEGGPPSSRAKAKYWARVKESLITESAERNTVVVEMVKQAEKPCLVFVNHLSHGASLEKLIRKAGVSVEFVNGNKVTGERRAAIKRLEYGEIDALVCTVVFNEGVDIPELKSVVIADGGKSPIAALQRIGRGMRVTPDKKAFEVWDISDEGTCLEAHSQKRRDAYGSEGYAVEDVFF